MEYDVKDKVKKAKDFLSGADCDPVSLQEKINYTPTDGTWDGERGRSNFTPRDKRKQDILMKYGNQKYVSYVNGDPDFTPFIEKSVKLENMGSDRQRNYSAAFKEQAKDQKYIDEGIMNPTQMRKYDLENELTPHERADGIHVDFVNADVHRIARHSGGRANHQRLEEGLTLEDGVAGNYRKIRSGAKIKTKQAFVKGENKVKYTTNVVKEKTVEKLDSMPDSLKYTTKDFSSGAKEGLVDSVIPLMSEGIMELCNVAKGEESMKDWANHMGRRAVENAFAGGTKKVAGKLLKDSVLSANSLGKIVDVGITVSDSAIKYVNGEISAKEFFDEIGEKATTQVVSMIGGEVGREIGMVIGAAIGSTIVPGLGTAVGGVVGSIIGDVMGIMITNVACTAMFRLRDIWKNTKKYMNDYKKMDRELSKIEHAALDEMKTQRNKLKMIIENEYKKWDVEIEEGFDKILQGSCKDICDRYNISEMIGGINQIMYIFSGEARFKSMEEWEEQLEQPFVLKIN